MRHMKEYTDDFDLVIMHEIYFVDGYVSLAEIWHRKCNLDSL